MIDHRESPFSADFTATQYQKLGQLVADKDAFLFLFEIARATEPLNLAKLCGRFRVSPQLIVDTFQIVAGLGMASQKAGTYSATFFGKAVVDMIETCANAYEPQVETSQSYGSSITMETVSGISMAATNNTIRGTLSSSSSAEALGNASFGVASTATDKSPTDVTLNIGSDPAEAENASRNHNYLR
ncbi:MAG TPA: hypothetical protein VMT61_04795 [Candidatus Binataceae bacterium]|nr:hypothetical protein [Candidatus Binataceae bacterium]